MKKQLIWKDETKRKPLVEIKEYDEYIVFHDWSLKQTWCPYIFEGELLNVSQATIEDMKNPKVVKKTSELLEMFVEKPPDEVMEQKQVKLIVNMKAYNESTGTDFYNVSYYEKIHSEILKKWGYYENID